MSIRDDPLAKIDQEKKNALSAVQAKSDKEIEPVKTEMEKISAGVRTDIVSAIRESQVKGAHLVLDDGTVLSWDAKQLNSANNDNTAVRLSVPASATSLATYYFATLQESK